MCPRGRRILFSGPGTFHTVFNHAVDDSLWSGGSRFRHGCTAGCQFHGCLENVDVCQQIINSLPSFLLIIDVRPFAVVS